MKNYITYYVHRKKIVAQNELKRKQGTIKFKNAGNMERFQQEKKVWRRI